MSNQIGPRWYGVVTFSNVRQIADAIERLLEDKPFVLSKEVERSDFFAYVTVDNHLRKHPSAQGDSLIYTWSNPTEGAGFNMFVVNMEGKPASYPFRTTARWPEPLENPSGPYVIFEDDRVKIQQKEHGTTTRWQFVFDPTK